MSLLPPPAGDASQVPPPRVAARGLPMPELVPGSIRDPLTSLASRALFLDRIKHALLRRRRHRTLFAVVYVRVDRLREIHAEISVAAAEELFDTVASRLTACVRDTDLVSHPGGDGFALLLEDISDPSDAARVADRIQGSLEKTFDVGGHQVTTTARIGMAVVNDGHTRPQELVRDADAAVPQAAPPGRIHYRMFDPAMHVVSAPEMEDDLRKAAGRGELKVLLQPIAQLEGMRITGAEAVLRWDHPVRGSLAPAEFAPVAEEAGLSEPLGRWLLENACRTVREWQGRLPGSRDVALHVNLLDLRVPLAALPSLVAGVLRDTGFPPRSLVVQVPESDLFEAGRPALDVLHSLRELKVRNSIDRFGMDYFSLGHLHRFPIDVLRVDASFVRGLGIYTENAAIVRTIVMLAASLGLETLANGVDSPGQIGALRELGCEFGQGREVGEADEAAAIERRLVAGG